MAIRLSVQVMLVYAAMLGYLAALAGRLLRRPRLSAAAYAAGFVAAAAAVAWRSWQTGQLPFQSVLEVFLFLGMLVFPLSVFCRRALGIGGETLDMALGLVLLVPVGLGFMHPPRPTPPALRFWMFGPHVLAYMAGYMLMAKACAAALKELIVRGKEGDTACDYEHHTYRLVCLGFPFMTVGLVLGAFWGKRAWGNWWNWDPKELWALATWLVYVGYLHSRRAYGPRHRKANSLIAVAGAVLIVITLAWAGLSRLFAGLHTHGA